MPRAAISGAREWKRVLSEGRAARCDGVTVRARRTQGGEPARLGVRVSARGKARSVRRNRARRRIRQAFEGVAPGAGWDVAVMVRPDAVDKDFQELAAVLDRAVSSATKDAP